MSWLYNFCYRLQGSDVTICESLSLERKHFTMLLCQIAVLYIHGRETLGHLLGVNVGIRTHLMKDSDEDISHSHILQEQEQILRRPGCKGQHVDRQGIQQWHSRLHRWATHLKQILGARPPLWTSHPPDQPRIQLKTLPKLPRACISAWQIVHCIDSSVFALEKHCIIFMMVCVVKLQLNLNRAHHYLAV